MARNINNKETLIVFEGVPYVLSKQSPNSMECPCDLCDLRVQCDGGDEAKEFYRLCTPHHLTPCYHFEEDWDVLALHVADFCVNAEEFEEIENSEYLPDNENKVEWTDEDINMIDWLIRCCEKEHEELCNDRYGHQDIVSDLKRDCRKKWNWLESLKSRLSKYKKVPV